MLIKKSINHVTINFQVIAAEGEQKASGALKEAAEVIQQSPHALQVRPSITTSNTVWSCCVVILK